MDIVIPPGGLPEPTLFETLKFVIFDPGTWVVAVGEVLLSSLIIVVMRRFERLQGRKRAVIMAASVPILLLLIADPFLAPSETPVLRLVLLLKETWMVISMVLWFFVGLVSAALTDRYLRSRIAPSPTKVFE